MYVPQNKSFHDCIVLNYERSIFEFEFFRLCSNQAINVAVVVAILAITAAAIAAVAVAVVNHANVPCPALMRY